MNPQDQKYFIRGLNSSALFGKLKKYGIELSAFILLEQSIISAICDGIQNSQQIVDYTKWFKNRILDLSNQKIIKQSNQKNCIFEKCKDEQKKLVLLEELLKGCGKAIPNDIKQIGQVFTWWFVQGNWKNSKIYNWRAGCNWGGNGTTCGFHYSDGRNYCQQCGKQIEELLLKK